MVQDLVWRGDWRDRALFNTQLQAQAGALNGGEEECGVKHVEGKAVKRGTLPKPKASFTQHLHPTRLLWEEVLSVKTKIPVLFTQPLSTMSQPCFCVCQGHGQ
jgi:hypothetical protein